MKTKISNMTEEQIKDALVSNAQRQRPHTPEELDQIVDWAHRVVVDFSLLEMTIRGNMRIQVLDGEVKFSAGKPPRGWRPRPASDKSPS